MHLRRRVKSTFFRNDMSSCNFTTVEFHECSRWVSRIDRATAWLVEPRVITELTTSKALICLVLTTCCYFVALQNDVWINILWSWVDCQATGILTAFFWYFGLSIVIDRVARHLNFHVFISCLVDNKAIDAVIKWDVVAQVKGTLVSQITGYVDSRAINDVALIPIAVVGCICSSIFWQFELEKRHVVTISVHYIARDCVRTGSFRLCEYNSTWCACSPPGITEDNVLHDIDVVRLVGSDAWTSKVMHVISPDINASGSLNSNSLSSIIRICFSKAFLLRFRPLTICGWAITFAFMDEAADFLAKLSAIFNAASDSVAIIGCFNSSNVETGSLKSKVLDDDILAVVNFDCSPSIWQEFWLHFFFLFTFEPFAFRGDSHQLEVLLVYNLNQMWVVKRGIFCFRNVLEVVLVAIWISCLDFDERILYCIVNCVLKHITLGIWNPISGAALDWWWRYCHSAGGLPFASVWVILFFWRHLLFLFFWWNLLFN